MTSSVKTSSEAIDAISASQFGADSMVTLLVGKNEQKMIAYSSYLTRDSEFFAAAMKKEWVEGQTRIVKLPEEDPSTMAHYLSFLYGGRLFAEEVTTMGELTSPYNLLASLYVCGERFLNRRLQSKIVEQLLRLTGIKDEEGKGWYPNTKAVNTIYRGTPEGSPGRRFLVDMHVTKGHRGWLDGELDAELIADVANTLFDRVQGLPFRKRDLKVEKYMHPF
jgi:hypothetical protein